MDLGVYLRRFSRLQRVFVCYNSMPKCPCKKLSDKNMTSDEACQDISIYFMQYYIMEAVAIAILTRLNDYQETSLLIYSKLLPMHVLLVLCTGNYNIDLRKRTVSSYRQFIDYYIPGPIKTYCHTKFTSDNSY